MPRFSMEYSREMKDVLKELGMTDAFDGSRADFSALATGLDMPHIGSVVHKAVLEVGEKGTKAAAATSVQINDESAVMDMQFLMADKPFFCAIVDKTTGAVLFAGAVTDPQPLED